MNFSTEKFNKGKHKNFDYFEMEKVEFDASNDFCTNPGRPICNLSYSASSQKRETLSAGSFAT